LLDKGNEIILQPFDVVSVKIAPDKVKQITVEVQGEVVYAGNYTLESPDERLSSVIKRAGGLSPYADINGGKVIRLWQAKDSILYKRYARANSSLTTSEKVKFDSLNLSNLNYLFGQSNEISLDLNKILQKPGSETDIPLKDGDILTIPRLSNTVSIKGEVLRQVTLPYEKKIKFWGYISAAGGFTRDAYTKRVFLVNTNGRSSKTKSFLGIRNFPKVQPGSEIFVPMRPPREEGFNPAKAGVWVSAISALVTSLILLLR
jgi:protein involved in polysaccharide export with SLBB domain